MKLRPAVEKLAWEWLPFAAVATVLSLTLCVALQQVLRASADDPQIGMAQDAAAALALGQPVSQVVPAVRAVAIARSTSPFIIVYGDDRQPRTATGTLDGVTPVPPKGVFDYAAAHGEDRLTWQPRPDVRLATVLVRYGSASGSGYVLAARSLREVELRKENVGRLVAFGWAASLVAAAAALALAGRRRQA
ncbi:MAG TPA: hypothetical protein VL500_07345 [Candidatus Eisenbacteria bacterium]|nr:hypothetical protein [Candidatus Eisenbacteria bacterium]